MNQTIMLLVNSKILLETKGKEKRKLKKLLKLIANNLKNVNFYINFSSECTLVRKIFKLTEKNSYNLFK